MGLGKIFIFSLFGGISFAFSYGISGDTSNVGFVFTVLNQFAALGDEQTQAAVLVLSLVVTIFFIFSLARFLKQIIEQRLAGIIIAILGFFCTFLILTGSQHQTFNLVLGIILGIIGIVIVALRSRMYHSKLK